MRHFFNLDNKILQIAGKAADVILLETMWFIASFPVVTAGVAGRAFYDTFRIEVLKDEGALFKIFWKSLKFRFFSTMAATLIYEIPVIIYISLIILKYMKGTESPIMSIFLLIGLIFMTVWTGMFIVQALILESSQLAFGKKFMTAYVIFFRKPVKAIFLVVLLIVMLIFVEKWIYLAMIFPALYMWIAQKLLEPIAEEYAEFLKRTDYAD